MNVDSARISFFHRTAQIVDETGMSIDWINLGNSNQSNSLKGILDLWRGWLSGDSVVGRLYLSNDNGGVIVDWVWVPSMLVVRPSLIWPMGGLTHRRLKHRLLKRSRKEVFNS